jgi:zinc transporter ZupT
VEELMPELYNDSHAKDGIFALALGFSLMLMLDIAL